MIGDIDIHAVSHARNIGGIKNSQLSLVEHIGFVLDCYICTFITFVRHIVILLKMPQQRL